MELCESFSAERGGQSEGGWKPYWDGTEDSRKYERHDFPGWHFEEVGIGDEQNNNHRIEEGQIANNAKDSFLLGAFDLCRAN